ncbi:signal peptide peptidase SppA, partial [bacterium]|nr:signal peptide peptidase SppA [bacterium]
KQYSSYIMPRTKIATIDIKGIIYDSNKYNKQLNKYFKNNDIKAILIKMECAGSAAGTAQSIFNEINILKKEYPTKPIVTLVENICTSGGFYIACATDSIVAPASALIGSIGSNLPYLFQLQEFMEEYKIKYTTIKAGKYKNAADPFTNITPEEQAMLQSVIDDSYDQFMNDVVKTRRVSLNNKHEWAEGKIFSGRQALKLGLIDIIGSSRNAIDILKDKALIKGEIEWIKKTEKTGFFSLFSGGASDHDSNSMFSLIANKLGIAFNDKHLIKRVF